MLCPRSTGDSQQPHPPPKCPNVFLKPLCPNFIWICHWLFSKILQYLLKTPVLESLFEKKKPILKKSVNGCLVHIMSLKTLKFAQDVTEMFISEFKNKESLCNVMSKIYKKRKVSKNCLNYLR